MSQAWVPVSNILKTIPKFIEAPGYAKNLSMIQIDKLRRNLSPRAGDGRAGKIRQFSVRITDLCNLRCHTCGQWGDSGFLRDCGIKALRDQEVSPDRYIELLRDLKEKRHTPSVYLWGGEPMLYKGSVEIIEEAARLGMAPSIATNGTGLAQHAQRLVKAPMFLIQISIDGPDAETHNACRPGANPRFDNFGTIISAIDKIRDIRKQMNQRLPLLASLTTINNLNYNRLVEIYDRFKDKVDICVFYLAWWIDQESADRQTKDFEERFGFKPAKHYGWIGDWRPPDIGVLSAQLKQLNRKSARLSGPSVIILPPLTSARNLEKYYTDHDCAFGYDRCVSVYSAVEINSNGDMSPCRDYHDFVVGNVKEKTITQIWNSAPYRKFRKSISEKGLMPVCTRCCGLMGY
ncbi:MAG: radical SAM protein [Desulfomonilaceae bacterium]